jgi:hypothetical protein
MCEECGINEVIYLDWLDTHERTEKLLLVHFHSLFFAYAYEFTAPVL